MQIPEAELALRVMGLFTPDKIPVGFALDKRRVNRRLDEEKQRFPRFSQIPSRTIRSGAWLCGFAPAMLAKKPIVLETKGLGKQSFHPSTVESFCS
jgi:carboxyl-terminal processing protease